LTCAFAGSVKRPKRAAATIIEKADLIRVSLNTQFR
jgi:hypothetical protein